jgi:hypothetical protein
MSPPTIGLGDLDTRRGELRIRSQSSAFRASDAG